MTIPPEFVVVGHVCQDILPGGGLGLGGSVSYAATAALQMGCRVGVVTSAGPGLELADTLPDAQIVCHRSESTTIFENIYQNGKRTQYLHQRADVITGDHIPVAWRNAPMVYLGSIDQEIDAGVFHCFSPDSLICVMPQGFFRRWDERGLVSFVEWTPAEDVLRRIDVLVISELDVPDPEQQVRDWQDLVKVMVVTRADRGATVYRAGEVLPPSGPPDAAGGSDRRRRRVRRGLPDPVLRDQGRVRVGPLCECRCLLLDRAAGGPGDPHAGPGGGIPGRRRRVAPAYEIATRSLCLCKAVIQWS